MKRFYLPVIFALLITNFSIAQDANQTIFKGLKVRFGFTGSYLPANQRLAIYFTCRFQISFGKTKA
ncbi:MAG TPA: hypothetical protein VGO58_08035 [Chitinophagaceae bacterium]|jgi:hypothetical protein|nr:hypothetical protein [Chitinophagaceae bacterium]